MLKVYGIKNCTTVKKALAFLNQYKAAYEWVDYKKTLPDKTQITYFLSKFGIQIINQQGTTYRGLGKDKQTLIETFLKQAQLDKSQSHPLFDEFYAIIKDNTSILKRPIVLKTSLDTTDDICLIGFDETLWQRVLLD